MAKVYVSMGSNVAPEQHLGEALMELTEAFGDLEASTVYQTTAVGFEGNDFLNLVIAFDTSQLPAQVAAVLRQIEAAHGRVRGEERFAPRTLDLDLLLYDDLVIDTAELRLPRDEISRHAFVLGPLAELAGDRYHPVLGRRYAEIWEEMEARQGPLNPFTGDLIAQGAPAIHRNHLSRNVSRVSDQE